MLNGWFRKFDMKRFARVARDQADRNDRTTIPPNPETFEQIYEGATVKPPKIAYGIQKVAEMVSSTHLTGMSPEFKRKALLMALHAAGTDEGEVLKDMVARQRALKEYEDSFLERMNQFEAAQMDQNRLQQAELDKVTSLFKARIQANLDEVERRHKEFRAWQENKRQELHRFAEAAALCVPKGSEEWPEAENNITPMRRPNRHVPIVGDALDLTPDSSSLSSVANHVKSGTFRQ
jgi:hypothetical protein